MFFTAAATNVIATVAIATQYATDSQEGKDATPSSNGRTRAAVNTTVPT
jgi:hypothetical protein